MTLQDVAKKAGGSSGLTVLSEAQLADLQKVLLGMMDDLNALCERHGLRYVMIGGTAIGALRHQGFIPWDDDIDIAMPRADFEKLVEITKQECAGKYFILDPREKHNYGRIIPKFRLKGSTYRTILERDIDDCGIFIDIYIIENISDNPVLRALHGGMCLFMGLALSCKRLYDGRSYFKELYTGASFYVKCALGFLLSFASLETWARWTDHWYGICKNHESKYVSVPADEEHFFGEINLRSELCVSRQVSFAGRTWRVPAAAEKYLTGKYGDFMTLPPEEKRVRNCYLEFDLGNALK